MKKKILSAIKFMYFFNCFAMLFTMHAHAYIDPSAVTYLIQAIAGVCIAIGAAATIFRHKIKNFFRKWWYKRQGERNNKKSINK